MNLKELNWDQLKSLLAVIEQGSLSAAARTLDTTQPTIGRHIDALENSIGYKLFVRSRYGLNPTEETLELLPHIKNMSIAANAFVRSASGDREAEISGVIRITASEIVGTETLPELLYNFNKAYPKIDFEILVSNDSENLLKREADIAIRMFRPEQKALVASKVGIIPIQLYATKSYIKSHGVPESISEIEAHTLIGHDQKLGRILRHTDVSLEQTYFNFRTDNELTQLALIRAGVGIGGIQKTVADRDSNLVHVLKGAFSIPMEMWLVMHEDLRTVKKIRLLFDFLKTELRKSVPD